MDGWMEFLSYKQFPVISSGRKIKPFLPAVSILKRLSHRMLEEVSLRSPLVPEPPPRAPAGEAREGKPGAELREPSAASRPAWPWSQALRPAGCLQPRRPPGDPVQQERQELALEL